MSIVNYEKEYENYLSEYYKIPRHVKDKLRNMPNNKGFICNGIWLYGLQRCTSSKITIMFEKIYPHLYIHEITGKMYKISRMNLNTKEKELISNDKRRVRNFGESDESNQRKNNDSQRRSR